MDGLQVAPLTAEKASKPLPEALFGDESVHPVEDLECDKSDKGTQKQAHTICRLSARIFWVIVVIILIAAIIAGVVGGVVGSRAKHSIP
jgi:hypothetical protein